MGNPTPTRCRNEILNELEDRWRAFQHLAPHEQQAINAERFLPVNELHDILHYFLTTGAFVDEHPSGWLRAS